MIVFCFCVVDGVYGFELQWKELLGGVLHGLLKSIDWMAAPAGFLARAAVAVAHIRRCFDVLHDRVFWLYTGWLSLCTLN